MPPLDTSIALQAKAPEMTNPLEMMLKVGQYKYLQQNSNKLQSEMDSTNALGQAIQRNTGPNGKVNLPGVLADAAQSPDAAYALKDYVGTNQTQQGQQISNQGGQIRNESDTFALHKNYTDTALQTASGLLQDPRITGANGKYDPAQASAALGEGFSQMVAKGVPVDQALVATAPFVNAIHTPGAVATMLQNSLRGQLGAGSQATVGAPSGVGVSDGQVSKVINTNGLSGLPVGAAIPGTTQQQKLGPSQLETVGQDPNGNPTVTTKNAQGAVVGVAGAPVQGQPTVAPRVIPATETPESYAGLQSSRQQTNTAASKVKEQNFNNRAIISILDNPKTLANPTGSNASWIADLSSKIGLPTTGSFASDYNQIEHYLAMQKQSNEKAMGVSSDAGRATAGAATGTTHMDPASLRKATALNDATATGVGEFNQGQEAAVARGGIPAIRQFQNAWSKYYDVNALRVLNATRAGDQTEIKDVVESLGGTKSAKFQAMRRNAQMLDQLKNGIIPNGGQ